MAVRNHFHNAKAGVESPVTKKLSGIRLLFADLKFMRRTHYIMQFYRIHLCVLLTKQDFHFTNMHLAYKTGFSFYKYASRLQSVAFRFTNGTLGLQFITSPTPRYLLWNIIPFYSLYLMLFVLKLYITIYNNINFTIFFLVSIVIPSNIP